MFKCGSFEQLVVDGKFDEAERMIVNGFDINSMNGKAVCLIIEREEMEKFEWLVRAGLDVKRKFDCCFVQYSIMFHSYMLPRLVELGLDVNKPSNLLIIAINWQNFESVKFLVEHGAVEDKKIIRSAIGNMTPFHKYKTEDVRKIVDYLSRF